MKKIVSTKKAPAAIGAYSQGVIGREMVFTSGQLGLDPVTGEMKETIEAQTHQALQNVRAILQEAGTNMDNVVKVTVFLKDMCDFPVFNEIYAMYFFEPFPARSAVQVARLPKDGLIEVEAIALL
ncbi:MAG: RidA family protein [Bacillales bacterium]|jgi:2-iminobutanoate/2-iminopropanoate deaminase|nr:RidA family protein [Bacillales bacterium]